MLKSKSRIEKNRRIYPYNTKLKLSELISRSTNKKNEIKLLPLTLNTKNNIKDINKSLKNNSLSDLHHYIPSSKPYIISSSIRKKIKYIKMNKVGALDTFHISTIKSSSSYSQKNILLTKNLKDNSCSYTCRNKPLIIHNNENSFINKYNYLGKNYRTIYDKNNKKKSIKHISSIKSMYFSKSKTDYSSLPTAALTARHFFKKPKDLKLNMDYNNYYDDSLGYKNANMKEPTYAKKGIIRSFMNEVCKIRKNNYKYYYLKLHEFRKN